jgi:hypothetical protein
MRCTTVSCEPRTKKWTIAMTEVAFNSFNPTATRLFPKTGSGLKPDQGLNGPSWGGLVLLTLEAALTTLKAKGAIPEQCSAFRGLA